MSKRIRRPSGGQPGNQNARKHGFYSQLLTPDQDKLLPTLAGMKGLDRYIEVAQVKVLSILAYQPQDTKLLFRALGTLNRLVHEQNNANSRATARANRTAQAVLRSIARSAQNEPRS